MPKFLQTTIMGGILFILPLVILIAVVGKAMSIVDVLATPFLTYLPVETIAGVAVIHILSLLIVIFLCFLAGIASGAPAVARWVSALEDNVLMKLPPYVLLKAKTSSMLNLAESNELAPILVRFDDSWQMAYGIESVPGDKQLIFLPGAPDAWSGSVCIVENERVKSLGTSVKSIASSMGQLGKGAA
ncbi:MAG: hypothetical protein V7711_17715, partial [Pseudomonadales bacterium]